MAIITHKTLQAKRKDFPIDKLTHQERVVIAALLTFLTEDNQPHPSKVNPDHYVLDIR